VAASVESAGADAVYFAGTALEAAAFLTQLRTIGVQSVFVTDGAADSTDFIRLAGAQVADGTFITCPCVDPEATPQGEIFAQGYEAAYGNEPGPFAVEGFDAANLILGAVAAGQTTPLGINSYLADHSFKGISKTIAFDSRGQVTSDVMSLMEVQNGALVYEGPLTP
jgi:branched-chain amino acid transport system substrate-binding protein